MMEIKCYAVITQFDMNPRQRLTDDALPPSGPIIHELYVEKAGSLTHARERAAALRGTYGWAYVAYVNADTDAFYNKEDAAAYAAQEASRASV